MKEIINEYLQSKSLYEDVDDVLINELIFNMRIVKQAKEDLESDGRLELVSDITRDPDKEPFYQKNRLVEIMGGFQTQ